MGLRVEPAVTNCGGTCPWTKKSWCGGSRRRGRRCERKGGFGSHIHKVYLGQFTPVHKRSDVRQEPRQVRVRSRQGAGFHRVKPEHLVGA